MAAALIAISACSQSAVPSVSPRAGASGAASAPATEAPVDDVSLVLDWLMDANKAPFVLGKEKGFFAEQGINLTISEGTGSGNSAKFVANDQYTFGTGASSAVVIAIANGVPVVMVANHQPLFVDAILVKADGPIKTIADLKGRSVTVGANTTEEALMPAVLEAAGFAESDVEIVVADGTVAIALWLADKADANASPIDGVPDMVTALPTLKVRAFPFVDYGFNIMNQGLITTKRTVRENPELVRRMVAAYAQSYLYAAEHKQELIDVVTANYPATTAASLSQQFEIVFSLVGTENTKGHPFGYMAPEDWTSAINALKVGKVTETEEPPEAFYTNDFIGDWAPLENLHSIPDLLSEMLQ